MLLLVGRLLCRVQPQEDAARGHEDNAAIGAGDGVLDRAGGFARRHDRSRIAVDQFQTVGGVDQKFVANLDDGGSGVAQNPLFITGIRIEGDQAVSGHRDVERSGDQLGRSGKRLLAAIDPSVRTVGQVLGVERLIGGGDVNGVLPEEGEASMESKAWPCQTISPFCALKRT